MFNKYFFYCFERLEFLTSKAYFLMDNNILLEDIDWIHLAQDRAQ
jgi:hypothetical protein